MSSTTLTHIPKVTKLTPSLIRILGCNPSPMTLQGTNTYLLGNGSERILFDAGDANYSEYIDNLKGVLQEEKATIGNIIVSHYHHDHLGGVKDVLNTLGIKENCNVWKYPRSDDKDIYPELGNVDTKKLSDGQEFSVEGAKFKVIHTPGHTTDHIIALFEENRAILSGDCILGETTAVFEDLYDYIKSLKRILNEKPSVIYPAHGAVVNDPIKRIEYYIEHRNQREKQIYNFLKSHSSEWFTDMQIVEHIYIETPRALYKAAAKNVSHHLEKLKKEDQVFQEIGSLNGTEIILWQFKQNQIPLHL